MNAREIVAALRSGEHPTIAKPTVPEVEPVLHAYFPIPLKSNGGAVHIIVCDGNVAQSHADWCLGWALEPNGYHEADCDVFVAWILKACSVTQRRKLDCTYPPEDPEAEGRFWEAADAFMAQRIVMHADASPES